MTLADRLRATPQLVQRSLAVLFLSAVLLSAWLLVTAPLKSLLTSQSRWRDSVRSELARTRGEAASLNTLTERSREFPSAAIWGRLYGDGMRGDVGAIVQQDLMRLCSVAGMQANSMSPLPSEKDGALFRYTVRISISGTADRFQTFLTQLRQSPHYLRVEKLSVTSPQTQRTDENAPLTIVADIVGFEAQRPATPPAAAT
jgi:Tfp pilus assembly protein PilO